MTTNSNRKLTSTQIRIIRAKSKTKSAPVAANDVVGSVETARKPLPADAVRIQIDVTSANVVRDVTKGGSDRVVIQGGGLDIVAFGEIASTIDSTKRIDGYCMIRDGVTKIIGYAGEGFVFNEHGDDWAPIVQEELQAAA